MEDDSPKSPRFPLKRTPEETPDRFPFTKQKYYINPQDERVETCVKPTRMGYMAQRSIHHLESTGRKPILVNVPWFTAAQSNGKR